MPNRNSEDFDIELLNIAEIPGSAEEVSQKLIEHYKRKMEDPKANEGHKAVLNAFIVNLEQYRALANLEGQNIREFLPYFTNVTRLVEDKDPNKMEVETSGRIKSLYSFYNKLITEIYDCIDRGDPVPQEPFIYDIYATKHILAPRGEMRALDYSFYEETYNAIYEYMDHINELEKKDPRYHLIEIKPDSRFQIRIPVRFTEDVNRDLEDGEIVKPKKDFVDTMLKRKGIAHIYRDLSDVQIPPKQLRKAIEDLQALPDLSDEDSYRFNPLYIALADLVWKKCAYKSRDNAENDLIKSFGKRNATVTVDGETVGLWDEYRRINKSDVFFNTYEYALNSDEFEKVENICKIDLALKSDFFERRSAPTPKEKAIIADKLQEIRSIDLSTFDQDLAEAKKIDKFSHSMKDYMRYMKKTGYQAVHLLVATPSGNYEVQFKTEKQNQYAETGNASRANYKPNETTLFHRLNIPKQFVPKRDPETHEILEPLQFGVSDFETSVRTFYKAPFAAYSGGLSYEEFIKKYPTKKEQDQAMLEICADNGLHAKSKGIIENFYELISPKRKKAETVYQPSTYIKSVIATREQDIESVPADIIAYTPAEDPTPSPKVIKKTPPDYHEGH